MKYHEKKCNRNPENFRPCFGCLFLTKKETLIGGYYYNGDEWEREVSLLFCEKKQTFLYTPQNKIKGGENKISNLQTLCKSCNSKKSDNYKDYRYGGR